jgi:hypothetical protein
MKERFKVKVDWWMHLIFFVVILSSLLPLIGYSSVPEDEKLFLFITPVLMVPFILSFYAFTFYELKDDHLYIRLSFLFLRLKYDDVKKIEVGRSYAKSNFALSVDRVMITRHSKGLLGVVQISPLKQDDFVYELKRRCKNLETRAYDEDLDF